jgi:hypothetical protein
VCISLRCREDGLPKRMCGAKRETYIFLRAHYTIHCAPLRLLMRPLIWKLMYININERENEKNPGESSWVVLSLSSPSLSRANVCQPAIQT